MDNGSQSFVFRSVKSVLCEAGAAGRIGELLSQMACKKALLVTDVGVIGAGLISSVEQGIKKAGINFTIFEGVVADPPESVIHSALGLAKSEGVDAVVGVGGGSSLDVAKLVALLAADNDQLENIYGVEMANGPRLPLILAPTTAGTGSEVTPISIVTTGDEEKKGVVTPHILPDWAVLDAELTMNLPSAVTAATGIDAMVHAIEAYTSKRLKNPMSDCLALEALRLLGRSIESATLDGSSKSVRQNMLLGAMFAGVAFANSPVGGVHALAYPVGARFHVPHGLSNSLMLPEVLKFNASYAVQQYSELAAVLVPGLVKGGQRDVTLLIDYLSDLPRVLGLETQLSEVGISRDDLPGLAADAMKQERLLINNPRKIQYDDALAIYEAAYG